MKRYWAAYRQYGRATILLSASIALLMGFVVSAESNDAGVAPQSYAAASRVDRGTIVSLSDKQQVEPAREASSKNVLGVVVNPNSLSVRVTNSSIKNETFVASQGTYPMLVSTQNGAIETGEYVTLSAIDGVAMLADTEQSMIVGKAQGSFSGGGDRLSRTELEDSRGRVIKRVDIGLIPVSVQIKENPNKKSTKADVPEFLERLGEQIAEKKVSPIRIYLSIAITGISLITALVILITGVRQSLLSIGRNPLSRKSIFRALIQIILTSFIILIIGLFAVYLLLRL